MNCCKIIKVEDLDEGSLAKSCVALVKNEATNQLDIEVHFTMTNGQIDIEGIKPKSGDCFVESSKGAKLGLRFDEDGLSMDLTSVKGAKPDDVEKIIEDIANFSCFIISFNDGHLKEMLLSGVQSYLRSNQYIEDKENDCQ